MHNVLLLLYTLEAAGAEKVVLSLVDRLDRRRYRPIVCGFRGGSLRAEFERYGIPVYVLDKRRGLDLGVAWRLVRLMKEHDIRIVHSHNFSANLWGRLAAIVAGVPVRIATEHSMPWIKSRIERGLDQSLAPLTTKIVSVSEAVRDAHLREERIRPDRMAVIYNGIERWAGSDQETAAFGYALRTELGIATDAPLCLTVGRLEPPKGHATLFEAIPRILASVPRARFVMAGDGSLRGELEASARLLGIEHAVTFLGARNDVRRLCAVADVAINPAHREGFSIAMLEAMSAGLPIVATDVGGNAEAVISGESGIIVPPKDADALASGAIRVLADRELASMFGSRARQRFEERFTIERMMQSIEALYALADRAVA
jgi:glycosyltransferase involved in cell wall biosynthesis